MLIERGKEIKTVLLSKSGALITCKSEALITYKSKLITYKSNVTFQTKEKGKISILGSKLETESLSRSLLVKFVKISLKVGLLKMIFISKMLFIQLLLEKPLNNAVVTKHLQSGTNTHNGCTLNILG